MSLTTLPIELVTRICSYLEQPERAALRVSCRSLYAKSLESFADRYFRSICFIATSEGMRQLEELAKSDTVRTGVRQLWMIPTVFEGLHDMDLKGFQNSQYRGPLPRLRPNNDVLNSRYAMYQCIVADHLALLNSSTFSARLHTCFASFRNLESVGLKHYATSFLLDLRQTEFRFLGSRKLRDQANYKFHSSNLNHLQWHYVAKANSLALSRLLQGFKSKQKIRVLNTCGANLCGSISPKLPLTEEQFNSLLPKLESLENLHMCICYDKEKPGCTPSSNSHIDLLIAVAPRLKKLVLSQWYQNERDMSESHFLELSRSIKFTQLKDLRLHWIQIRSESSKSFLITAKGTLNSLSLELVTLKTETPPKINPEPTSWRHIWEFLGEELSLQSFYMGNIGYWGRKVMIQGLDDSVEPTYSIQFDTEVTGISFNDWIRQFKPVLLESWDLSVRVYPDLLESRNLPSTEASTSSSEMHERCPQPLGLGSQNAEPELCCYPDQPDDA